MAIVGKFRGVPAMASAWRRRRVCSVKWTQVIPAALHDVNAVSAVLKTRARPPLGTQVDLCHPEAGTIRGMVDAVQADGFTIAFPPSSASMAFALAALTADMSEPV